MNELESLQKRQNHIFILVCVNFLLFMILFGGLGYVTYQSTVLVNRLKGDLEQAEQAVAALQLRLQDIDMDAVTDRVVEKAGDRLGVALQEVVSTSDLVTPLTVASERISVAQERMDSTGEAVRAIGQRVQGLDSDDIARRVSYHILKGLGDGFQQAADERGPEHLPPLTE